MSEKEKPKSSAAATSEPPELGPLSNVIARLHALDIKQALTFERLCFTFVIAVAAGMTLPFLGSIGLFDPWETHYGEVARRMAEDDDYLYPSWKKHHFFSKPVLLFWLTSIGYKIIGAADPVGPMPAASELVARLPSALFALGCIAAVYLVVRRLVNRRAAVLSSLVLATIPFWGFMSRQAITDMLYVAPMSSAILLLALAFFDDKAGDKEKRLPAWLIAVFGLGLIPQAWEIGRSGAFLSEGAHRVTSSIGYTIASETAWRLVISSLLVLGCIGVLAALYRYAKDPLVHAAAFLVAIATLGKGPHAVLLTGVVFFVYLLISWEWTLLKRRGLLTGIGLFLLVAAPWYLVMSIYDGRDDSKKTWVGRFILWDLFGRIGKGVHGDRGTSEYYVKYLSVGMFPWAAYFPIATIVGALKGLKRKAERTKEERFVLLAVIWAVSYFVFFTATTTKFHHYIFPVVVPAALLIGWWLDKVLRDKDAISIGLVVIGALGTIIVARDLAKEPWQLVDLFTYHYKSWKPDYYFPTDPDWRVWVGAAAGLSALAVLVGAALEGVAQRGIRLPLQPAIERLTRAPKSGAFVLSLVVSGLIFQVFAQHVYFARISEHWTQKWLLATYYEQRKPNEPIISYQMDWKGETFYGHDDEILIKKKAADLKTQADKPGRAWVLVQTDRLSRVQSAVGKKHTVTVVDRSNKKWFWSSSKTSRLRRRCGAPTVSSAFFVCRLNVLSIQGARPVLDRRIVK